MGGMTEDEMIAQAMRQSQMVFSGAQPGRVTPTPLTPAAARPAAPSQPPRPDRPAEQESEWRHDAPMAALSAEHLDEDAALARAMTESAAGEAGPPPPRMPPPSSVADSDADRQLAMAIEASYMAQTEEGRGQSEEELLQQAMRASAAEEEARQRQSLRQQQDAELQESMLMDQMREQQEQKQRDEEAQLVRLEAERVQEEQQKAAEAEANKARDLEAKKARIPDEPPAGDPRVMLQLRMLDGKKIRRAFACTDLIGAVYDYVDVEMGTGEQYKLVSTMPHQEFVDRSIGLSAAGLSGQVMLVLEPLPTVS